MEMPALSSEPFQHDADKASFEKALDRFLHVFISPELSGLISIAPLYLNFVRRVFVPANMTLTILGRDPVDNLAEVLRNVLLPSDVPLGT